MNSPAAKKRIRSIAHKHCEFSHFVFNYLFENCLCWPCPPHTPPNSNQPHSPAAASSLIKRPAEKKNQVHCSPDWWVLPFFFFVFNYLIENWMCWPCTPSPHPSQFKSTPLACRRVLSDQEPCCQQRIRTIAHLTGEFLHFVFSSFQLFNWKLSPLTLPFLPIPLPLQINHRGPSPRPLWSRALLAKKDSGPLLTFLPTLSLKFAASNLPSFHSPNLDLPCLLYGPSVPSY